MCMPQERSVEQTCSRCYHIHLSEEHGPYRVQARLTTSSSQGRLHREKWPWIDPYGLVRSRHRRGVLRGRPCSRKQYATSHTLFSRGDKVSIFASGSRLLFDSRRHLSVTLLLSKVVFLCEVCWQTLPLRLLIARKLGLATFGSSSPICQRDLSVLNWVVPVRSTFLLDSEGLRVITQSQKIMYIDSLQTANQVLLSIRYTLLESYGIVQTANSVVDSTVDKRTYVDNYKES